MKVRVFPSHLMRENKQAQGAGADRVSQGMTLAFGIPIGRAARVRAGQAVFSILCMADQKDKVKAALHRAKAKFPCKVHAEFHTDIKSLGTLPSKAIEEIVEVKKVEAVAGTKEQPQHQQQAQTQEKHQQQEALQQQQLQKQKKRNQLQKTLEKKETNF